MNILDFDGIIFDMDGTLLDSLGIWVQSDITFITEQGFEYDSAVSAELKKMHFSSACEYLKQRYSLEMSETEIGERIMELVRKSYLTEAELKPFVYDFVSGLHQKGVKMCVATSNEKGLAEGALKNTGIYPMMRFVITSDEVGEGKETPKIFLEAAKKLGTAPERTLVFEDSLHALVSAKNGEFYTIGVYEERFADEFELLKKEAQITIRSFGELTLGEDTL
ncbi:MAG: HAD family phosphatase [Oscillospiraceae bacterium]|nr:HAD family phosphatase [Oscillospiraceae bacterium]